MIQELYREHEAAKILGVTIRCLQRWRVEGKGPLFVRVSGRCVRYTRKDLEDFINARRVQSTSEPLPC